jgi:PIN domain nuclease of toxin-antitoxin system
MRLLIDTHALVWFCEGSPHLSIAARAAIEDEANERYISHAVPWEMAVKLSLGKLPMQVGFDVIFPGVLDANGFVLLPGRMEHYEGLINLPRHHGDPFDRLMVAQARAEGLTIVSCDSQFAAYDVPLLW